MLPCLCTKDSSDSPLGYICWPLDGQHGSGAFLTHVLVHVQTSIGWALTVWAIPARLSPLRIVSCAWNQCSSILHYFVSEILDPHLHFKDSRRDPPSEAEGEAICNFVKFTKEPLEIGKILVSQGQGRPMDMFWDDLTRSRAFVDPAFLCLFTGGYLEGGVQCLNRQSTLNAGTKCKRNARRKGRKLTTFSRKKWCLCNVHWTFRSFLHLPQVSCTYVLISNSWHAWLGIVDQNWLKLAWAKLTLGQSISLKVVGMPIPVIITVRSKFPFICMKYLTNPANSTGNPIP